MVTIGFLRFSLILYLSLNNSTELKLKKIESPPNLKSDISRVIFVLH
ncbi:MAG: hypothetical protein ACJAYB_001877 [Psychromonas sp.]|jgi:hypothetical protein